MKKYPILTWLLTASDLEEVFNITGPDLLIDLLINRFTEALESFDADKFEIPVRTGFNYQKVTEGLVEFMPVHEKGKEVVLKVVGYHPNNPNKLNLPTILSNITLYDTKTGHLKTIMDGVLPTALRTAAASAVASRAMAHPESEKLGLIGCGAQAVVHLHALSRVFPIKSVWIYDIDTKTMENFKDRIQILDLDLEVVCSDIPSIVDTVDILCTATSIGVHEGPLFEKYNCQPHLHINAVGSDFPGKMELPHKLLLESVVVPDFREQAKIEGECQQLEDHEIGPDLQRLVANPGIWKSVQMRKSVFDSTGWAYEDQIVAHLMEEQAGKLGLGTKIYLESVPADVKNPYHFLTKPVQV
jgi:ornithine cyclodeaminase/alanine dehydrogenase-like protein (mu-crystallin family)